MIASATNGGATAARRSPGYQIALVALLSLNFGIVFFDRNALNFLMPYVQPDLQLSNTQIGFLAAGLSFTWAIAAFGVGKLSDALGKRKILIVISTILFSACSFLSGIASSFAFLLATRLLMGVAEGGVMPLSHAMVATEVAPERRGLAQGIAQNFGSNLLGSFVAPVLLVAFAEAYGWRSAFYLAGIPGIVTAIMIWFMLDEPAAPPKPAAGVEEKYGIMDAMRVRNVAICVVMGILLVAYLVICWAFMPQFLTSVLGYSGPTMGWLMGTLGISATIGSFAISALSDRIGRRPVMIAMPFIAMILPLGAMFVGGGNAWLLGAIFFVGWGVNGIFPLFMATVPSESVDPRHAGTVLGLCMGACEILGGVSGPAIAGVLADATGTLTAPLWLMTGLTALAGVAALGLRETAPSKRGPSDAAEAFA